MNSPATVRPGQKLSLGEIKVIKLMARGYSNKEISAIMETSEQTIKNGISAIFIKLGASNRAHTVYIYMTKLVGMEEV